MSVLIYKDDSNTTINGLIEKIKEKIGKSGTVKETYTTSNVIKQISPTLLINSNKMVIPKFKLDEKGIEDIDLKIISNKDNITTLKTIDDEIINFNNSGEKDTDNESIDVLEQSDENDPRLPYDKENLLKAFYLGMDPFESCIKSNKKEENEEEEEDEEEYGLNYLSLAERMEQMFDIKLQN